MAAVVVALLVADNVRTLRLRDVLTIGGLAVTVAVTAAVSLAGDDRQPLVGTLAGAAALFALCFLAEFARPGMLGFGTVKASALLGAAAGGLGLDAWVAGLGGFVVGIVAIGLLGPRLPTRSGVPSGPAIAVGLVAALVVALLPT